MEISKANFSEIFGMTLSSTAIEIIEKHNFKYNSIDSKQSESAIIRYIDFLMSEKKKSGPEYQNIWEKGWQENLDLFKSSGNISDLIPKFVRKSEFVRFQGSWISPEDPNFETNFVELLRDVIFRKFFSNSPAIWEVGSGTGLNLVHLSRIFPEKDLVGCDWANSSIDIISELNKHLGLNIKGHLFDLFSPNLELIRSIKSDSGLLTIGTLEQSGENFHAFLDFVLASPFKTVVHLETNYELYDKSCLFDYLAVRYIEKRNWLKGYFAELRILEQKGKIRIIDERKTFGSFFHDGYTYTVWEKVNV
jgi:hypothetical protein